MPSHEYRVVPAPRRGIKAKGARRPEDRFAHAVESEMNRMAAEGWEYVRSDTLPRDHKAGWFSRPVTVYDTVLVFRRAAADSQPQRAAAPMPPPMALTPPSFVAAPAVANVPPPTVAAPAASRFTPPPSAQSAANDIAPVAIPPGPALTLVKPAEDPQNPRHAAE